MTTFLLMFVTLSAAGDKSQPKPNTLTPKEIADGWVLLFDGETAFGWKAAGEVKADDGLLVLGGAKESSVLTTTGFPITTCPLSAFRRVREPSVPAGRL